LLIFEIGCSLNKKNAIKTISAQLNIMISQYSICNRSTNYKSMCSVRLLITHNLNKASMTYFLDAWTFEKIS